MEILIVGKDTEIQESFKKAANFFGHKITIYKDVKEALKEYQKVFYPLIVLDTTIQYKQCINFLKEIRGQTYGGQSIIYITTDERDPEIIKTFINEGANDYLIKPLSSELLKIRLQIAERYIDNLIKGKDAEAKYVEVCGHIEKSRDDMLSILNQLRIGTIMTDKDGKVVFLSKATIDIINKTENESFDVNWGRLLPLKDQDIIAIRNIINTPEKERIKISVNMKVPGKGDCWMDIEVKDAPDDPQKKIFFLYDMSEVYDLRHILKGELRFHDLIGKSKSMLQVYEQIQEIAKVDWIALIEGETGTGKELVARAIHFSSHRKEMPFIAVNCAGLTDSLLASQLFGHKRGAFTGAVSDSIGVFESADGGTILLDEVGDISTSVQTNLLRVLETKEITRLGETRSRKIDVRVIASTHHDLSEDVKKGIFRQDLYYRIRVARIHLPALRDRREDIALLAENFLKESNASTGKTIHGFSNEAMRVILEYNWPGNVRELKSAIEFALLNSKTSIIQPEDFPPEIISSYDQIPLYNNEEGRFLNALEKTKGNRTAAARLLGLSRATFYRHLSKLNLPVTK